MVVFNPKVFNFRVFDSVDAQKRRFEKTVEMLAKYRNKPRSEIPSEYWDCLGEVKEYSGDGSWVSRTDSQKKNRFSR